MTIKKALVAMLCLVTFQVQALADNNKPITVSQLPAVSQNLIKQYFSNKKVAHVQMETGVFEKSYDLIFNNGEKIEFDKKGNWTEIDCKHSSVPSNLVPSKIRSYVNNTYSGAKIKKIEKDKNEYEIKLSNGMEITFNKKFQVIDVD